MPEEKLEVIRRANAAFNRGDLQEWAQYWDPDVVFEDHNSGPDQEPVTRGLDNLRAIVGRWREAMPDFRVDIEEELDAGDAVVYKVVYRGSGVGSGASVELAMVDVAWVNDGRITRYSSGYSSMQEGEQAVRDAAAQA